MPRVLSPESSAPFELRRPPRTVMPCRPSPQRRRHRQRPRCPPLLPRDRRTVWVDRCAAQRGVVCALPRDARRRKPAGASMCPTATTQPTARRSISTRTSGGRARVEWMVAGRAVQIVEWARTHRFCGRCGGADGAATGRAGDAVPGVRAVGLPAACAGNDHAGHHGRARRCWRAVSSSAARCTAAWPASSNPASRWRARSSARSARRSASRSATCGTGAASRGRFRTA